MKEDQIIICRCSDLTQADIKRYLDQGFTSLDEIKRVSRCCMGPCQGRTCRDLILKEIAAFTGRRIEDLAVPTQRPPSKPVLLGAIAGGVHDEK